MKIKPLKNYWIVSFDNGVCFLDTISSTKKESIQKFLKDSSLEWSERNLYGWVCKKINILFEVLN